MTITDAAMICHQANKAYCQTQGDYSQPEWIIAPEWQKKSAETGVVFHVASLALGNKPSPSASHESWLREKEADGWRYGEVKDPVLKTHPCFTNYENLPVEQRAKDYIFASIVEALYNAGMLKADG